MRLIDELPFHFLDNLGLGFDEPVYTFFFFFDKFYRPLKSSLVISNQKPRGKERIPNGDTIL